MAEHNDLGRWGEELAVQKLICDGCAIVERNWQSRTFEMDIIAMRGSALVFCEVKTRRPGGDPYEALTHRLPHEIQFDFFAIVGTPGSDDYTLDHIPDMTMPLLTSPL